MQSSLAGRVRNTSLAVKHALLPLFEAIANSVDAIAERGVTTGEIVVTVQRQPILALGGGKDGALVADVAGFVVEDTGVGFTEKNFASFNELDSLSKQAAGGRGIGRLSWLVAFEDAVIDSASEEADAVLVRHFTFQTDDPGVTGHTAVIVAKADAPKIGTRVHLRGFRGKYSDEAPKRCEAIAKRVIEHFLVDYMLGTMPKIILRDDALSNAVDLSRMYEEEFRKSATERSFEVGGEAFKIVDVLLRPTAETANELHFCANRRRVRSTPLKGAIPHTDGSFSVDGQEALYAACITGPFLDAHVDAQRTGFSLDHDGQLGFNGNMITWDQVSSAATNAAKEFLADHLTAAREQARARVRQYVEQEEPRYRILLEHRAEAVADIPATATGERLEVELHKILQDWRLEAKKEARASIKAVENAPESFPEYHAKIQKALSGLMEVGKADLADYVMQRRAVLSFFELLLGRDDDDKTSREDALHSLFFPMRTTSDLVDYEDHNLWVLDERLAFHSYLASDLQLKSQKKSPVKSKSGLRPDLAIYNRGFAFSEDELAPFRSIVIVEFKRPDRKEYSAKENPVSQVYEYVRELRQGKVKDRKGAAIDPLGDEVPAFCHIIATITPQLRAFCEDAGLEQGPDGDGYFGYNKSRRAYVEVSSYAKILNDALKRNKVFFEKLTLPSGRHSL